MADPANPIRQSPMAVFAAIGGVYVAQSVISGLTFTALPAVLRDRSLPLDQVGLIYLAILPWAIKFLWAPAIERYRLPPVGADRSRSVVFAGGLISAAGLWLAGLVGLEAIVALIACLIVVAFAAATVDIACDGYAVEALSQKNYGLGNAAQVGGAYLGSAIGSGLFLFLVDRYDWTFSTWAMAGLLVVLGLPFLFGPAGRAADVRRTHTPSLSTALRRPEVRTGLLLAAVYVAAQKWGQAMMGPFLVDSGIGLPTIAMVNGLGGMGVGLFGAFVGGIAVRKFGTYRIMTSGILLQAMAMAAFAALAAAGTSNTAILVILALASSSGIMAFGFVALYAQFMRFSDPRQGGVDFTLFQCADAMVSMLGGVGAGWLAERFGHASCFSVAATIAVLALIGMHAGRTRVNAVA